MKVERHQRDASVQLVGIMSDSHARTASSVVDLMRRCDLVLHAGDVMDYTVLDEIGSYTDILAVAGNNDHRGLYRPDATGHAGVAIRNHFLPDILYVELPTGLVAVEHGHRHDFRRPAHSDLRAAHPEARIIVYGHTHHSVVDDSARPLVLNPGAAGMTRNHGGPSCQLLRIDCADWEIASHKFPEIPC